MANPLRKPDPNSTYEPPPVPPRESAGRSEWPMDEETRMPSRAPGGWSGYLVGAVILVLALIAVAYFGFGNRTADRQVTVPADQGQTTTSIPKQVTPPASGGQQNTAPGTTPAPQTTQPQTTQPQTKAPQPGTSNP